MCYRLGMEEGSVSFKKPRVLIELPAVRKVVSVELAIDEVFRVLERSQGRCPNIPIATE